MNYAIPVLFGAVLLMGSESGMTVNSPDTTEGASFFADGFEFISQLDCDPLNLMSCDPNPSTSACFISLIEDNASCGPPLPPGIGQSQPCQFLNDCSPGLSCMLLVSNQLSCSHHCDPATGTTAHGTNCADLAELTEGACVPISDYWAGTTIDHVGLCLDCALAENAPFCD